MRMEIKIREEETMLQSQPNEMKHMLQKMRRKLISSLYPKL